MSLNLSRNEFVRRLVTVNDFMIINIILVCFILLLPNDVPNYFHSATKITVFTANAAMGVAQYFFNTIVHYRKIEFDKIILRVSQLVTTHVILTYVFLSFLCPRENFFHISVLYHELCTHHAQSFCRTRNTELSATDWSQLTQSAVCGA